DHAVLSSPESHVARRPRPTTSTRFDEAMIGKEKKALSPSPSPAARDGEQIYNAKGQVHIARRAAAREGTSPPGSLRARATSRFQQLGISRVTAKATSAERGDRRRVRNRRARHRDG